MNLVVFLKTLQNNIFFSANTTNYRSILINLIDRRIPTLMPQVRAALEDVIAAAELQSYISWLVCWGTRDYRDL